MKVYFGRDSLKVASELIALYDHATAQRIATYQVKRLAFRVTAANAGNVAFWAGVLARSNGLVIADPLSVRCETPGDRMRSYDRLERRSRPQVLPDRDEPVTKMA